MIASTPVLFFAIAAFLCVWWYRRSRYYMMGNEIPGPPSVPILGNAAQLFAIRKNIIPTLHEYSDQNEGIFKYWIFHKLVVIISKPEYLQAFFTNTSHSLEKPGNYQGMVELTGTKNIFVSNGEDWKKARMIFVTTINQNPAHQDNVFAFAANKLIAEFREKANGETFGCVTHFRKLTFYVAWGNIFGELGRAETLGEELVERLEECEHDSVLRAYFYPILNTPLFKLLPRSKKYFENVKFIRENMESALLEKISDYQDLKKNNKALPNNFFYNYMEKYPIDDLQLLVEEYIMLLETSVLTTPVTLGYLLICLGLNPQVQEKVLAEFKDVTDILGREPETNDRHMSPYLDRVIKESLRIFPMFGIFGRVAPCDIKFGKYTVPKGAIIAPFNLALSYNPKLYPDPFKFDPDRFLQENVDRRPPLSYLPFMSGPRSCPGKSYAMSLMKLVTPVILKEFKVVTHYKNVEEVLENTRFQISMFDEQNFPIKLVPRN